jgi:hypothetical protein
MITQSPKSERLTMFPLLATGGKTKDQKATRKRRVRIFATKVYVKESFKRKRIETQA